MRISGQRIKRLRLVQTDRYVVAVDVELVIPDDDPSEPCYEAETVQFLKEVEEHVMSQGQVHPDGVHDMTVTTVPNISMSSEVDSLAEQLGVRAELPTIIAMTRCVFPEAVVSIEIDDDPEIANDFHLAIVVRAARFTGQGSVDAYRRWHRELSDVCPAPMKHVFRLSVEFDE